MPVSVHRASIRSILGWFALTPAELVLLAGVVALTIWGALPHYRRWEESRNLAAEQQVILRVRATLHMPRSATVECPSELDDCPDGVYATECLFFDEVLEGGISDPQWRKVDGLYLGPAGGFYRYDRENCLLRQVAEPVDES
jgi:hypothetical protein